MSDQYEYEVFISYRRAYEWHEWVAEIFKPLLLQRLDRGDRAAFLDTAVEGVGTPWPPRLAAGMSRSKVLLVLWTRQYYEHSHWCRTELDFFLERERTVAHHSDLGLIVPVVLNHPPSIHERLKTRSPLDLSDYTATFQKRSESYEKLDRLVKTKLVPALDARIDAAPAFDRQWDDMAMSETQKAIAATRAPVQRTVPSLAGDSLAA